MSNTNATHNDFPVGTVIRSQWMGIVEFGVVTRSEEACVSITWIDGGVTGIHPEAIKDDIDAGDAVIVSYPPSQGCGAV